ncbi:hypothetical protein [Helicobacter sp. 23-1045]
MNPHKELVCKENGRIFRLYTNGIAFDKIQLDDGQNDERKKCDYLITKHTKDIQIFIELKGNKIAKAYQQILTSYENRENMQSKCYAAIVCSKYPQIDSTIQILQRKTNQLFEKVFVKINKLETQYNLSNDTIEKIN